MMNKNQLKQTKEMYVIGRKGFYVTDVIRWRFRSSRI